MLAFAESGSGPDPGFTESGSNMDPDAHPDFFYDKNEKKLKVDQIF
jgi:hypothetical protein